MSVDLTFLRDNTSITLPVNPENINISIPGNNEKVEIIALGEVVVPREPGLSTFDISSFFPPGDSDSYIDFFDKWRDSKKSAEFTAGGLGINMPVVIEDFSHERRSGEEDRVYYNIAFSEYRPYGAKIIILKTETTASPTTANRASNKEAVTKTYTVKTGDSLWKISKALSNQGGSNWKELYNANKSVIGSNPDLIYPGQVYTIPSSWVTK